MFNYLVNHKKIDRPDNVIKLVETKEQSKHADQKAIKITEHSKKYSKFGLVGVLVTDFGMLHGSRLSRSLLNQEKALVV